MRTHSTTAVLLTTVFIGAFTLTPSPGTTAHASAGPRAGQRVALAAPSAVVRQRTARPLGVVVTRTVTVTPTRATPGTVVTVTASGFEPSADLNVTVSGYAGSIGVVRSDVNGDVVPAQIRLPTTLAFGTHTLSVVNTGTHLGAGAAITIDSTVGVTPTTVAPGEVVTVTALGFEPDAALNVIISGHAGSLAVVHADATGGLPPTPVRLPATLPAGVQTLSVVNTATHHGASARLTVAARLSVTPTRVAPGGSVTLTAAGFDPNTDLNVTISGHAGSIAVVHSDAAGVVAPTRVTIPPSVPVGVQTLSVINTATHRGVSVAITIGATISVTPTTVRAGQPVTLTAAGFAPNTFLNVTITHHTGAIGVVRSDISGLVAPTRITIPGTVPAGMQTLSVINTATHRGASARISVEAAAATLAVTPTITNRGGLVTVSGTGYLPGEQVRLALSGTTAVTATATADAQGRLPATGLSIPYSVRVGLYTISATGLTSQRTSSTPVTVAPLHPAITLSTTTASPGALLTIHGTGFGRQEQVTLALNGAALVTAPPVITTTNGAFTASITVPHSLLQGANTVSAVGNESRVTAVTALTGTLPQAARFYFAGGLNSATDHSVVQVLNTHDEPASVQLTFYFQNGAQYLRPLRIPPHTQRAVSVGGFGLPAGAFGLVLAADRQVAAQLTINRDGRDGDTLLGNTGLGTTWYLAEGYTGLSFHESVSILNPDPTTPARVLLHLLPMGGRPGKTVVVFVPAHTNTVTDINALLPGQSLSIVAQADRPVVVERTLTFSTGGYGLTTQAGTNNAATTWLFAEGTTVNRFQTFLTILNPNTLPAVVTASFFSRTGTSLGSKTIVVRGHSRANIKLNDLLSASGVASVVTANAPIVVERPEYFGSPNAFDIAGSDVFGRNGAGVRWSFPGGNTAGNSEFLLLYNPSAVTVPVTVTLYGSMGQTLRKTLSVPPTVRYNVDLSRVAPGFDPSHGAVVQSASGVGIVAEQTVFAPNHATLRSTEGLAQ